MSYTLAKRKAGQEVVKALIFYCDKCRYTTHPFTTFRSFSPTETKGDANFTGVIGVTNVDASWISTWAGVNVYVRTGYGEIIKVSFTLAGNVNIIARRQFGSPAGAIISGANYDAAHSGELDGTCAGYSQTCSDPSSYEENLNKTLMFSSAPLANGAIYHAGLDFKGVSYDSAEIKPGDSIGSRSRLSFTINDQRHNGYDVAFYKHMQTENGTLFGKLLAAHPHFNGRKILYMVGLRDAGSLATPQWDYKWLIIDDVNLSDGKFTGTALDPLILTESKKAKMPLASPAQLTVPITNASTTLTFGNAPAGYFGTSGNIIVRIGSELLEVTANGTTTMPIISRGFGNTEKKDAAINATVQNCIRFIDEHVVDCITYALQTWTNLPATALGDYSSVKSQIPAAIISDYVLSAPMDVFEFVNYCIKIGNLVVYFDDGIAQKLVIKYVDEFKLSPIFIDESNHIILGSAKRIANAKEHYTRFNLSWAPYDLTKDTDAKNYATSLTAINADLEGPRKYNEPNEKKALLLPMLNGSPADYLLGSGIVSRVVNTTQPPEIFECNLDAEQVGETLEGNLELGSIVNLSHSDNQNIVGATEKRLYQVTKISGDPFESFKVKFRRYQLNEPTDYDVVVEAGTYINFVLTDFMAANSIAPFAAGEHVIYLRSGSVFGSNVTSLFAFDTGNHAVGVTLKIIVFGSILGMGGAGGNFGWDTTSPQAPTNGENGGGAFIARCPCVIDCGSGIIWAGGAGGNAGMSHWVGIDTIAFNGAHGGNAGQGFGVSLGGYFTTGTQYGPLPPPANARGGNGSQLSQGTHPYCSAGGAWGESGGTLGDEVASIAGIAGEAIKSNGYTVTIIAGNNALSIRGRRT